MADAGRKDFSQQAKETLKPQSQKTYTEQASEQLTGNIDRAKGAFMPDSQKSAHQQAFDNAGGRKDNSNNQDDSMLDKAKNKLGLD